MLPIWGILTFAVLMLTTWWYFSCPRNLPPGLPRFPFIGSLPFLTGDLRQRLTDLKDSYGEVSSVYLGETLVVVLNGLDIIRDTFVKRGQFFSDRPDCYYRDHVVQGRGIAFSNGENWKVVRRFSLQALKEFGMGKAVMEGRITEEIDAFMRKLSENNDRSVDLDTPLANAVCNIACSVVLGKRFRYGDPKFLKYMNHLKGLIYAGKPGNIVSSFPWLRHVPGDPFGFHEGRSHNLGLLSIHQEIIHEHNVTRSGNEQRDIIDVFADRLSQIDKEQDPVFSEPDLLQASQELVGGGTETTTTTLRWGILFLTQNQKIQKQLQDEVDAVLGDDVPKYSMRQKLPKVEAYILEQFHSKNVFHVALTWENGHIHIVVVQCLRLGDIIPFGVPHAPVEDTTINGFSVPKGTMVMANLYGVHYDPEIWGDPERFRPWRFLTEDGIFNKDLSSYILAFSLGKRACPGEGLARMELFLFSCRLLQTFTFSPPDGEDLDKVGGILEMTYMPSPHKIKIKLRKDI